MIKMLDLDKTIFSLHFISAFGKIQSKFLGVFLFTSQKR